jgi:hypothetical protein
MRSGEAVSLSIALLHDTALSETSEQPSDATARAAPEAPPTTTTSKPPAAVAHDATPERPEQSAPSQGWKAHAELEAGGGYGLGGAGSLLGFGRVGTRVGAWVLDIAAGGSLPVTSEYDGGAVH